MKLREPQIPAETITLIKEMAANNRLWGAERIRGELLKVGIKVAKRTVQRYMRQARAPRPRGQTWATFIQNHANDIWACDFLQIHDVFFRPLFAFLESTKKSGGSHRHRCNHASRNVLCGVQRRRRVRKIRLRLSRAFSVHRT